MPTSKKKPCTNQVITKRLQMELQATIAFGAYDSNELLKAGKSMNRKDLMARLQELYLPTDDSNKVGHVDLFLKGYGKYKSLFEKDVEGKLVLPKFLHCLDSRVLFVGDNCICRSLLTRKNLKNMVDISAKTLYRHAKEVESNCKKALSICLNPKSKYRDGKFPSGENWFDYIGWVRREMYKIEREQKIVVTLDDDEEAESSIDGISMENECNNEEMKNEKPNDDDGNNDSLECEDPPEGEYFKGFFAFAIWGFIPPNGEDEHKSILISSVLGDESERISKKDGRKSTRENHKKSTEVGNPGSAYTTSFENKFAEMMMKHKVETQRQKNFNLLKESILVRMEYYDSSMTQIIEEIKCLDNTEEDKKEKRNLRDKLKEFREMKGEVLEEFNTITSNEIKRREIDRIDFDVDSMTNVTDLTDSMETPLKKIKN